MSVNPFRSKAIVQNILTSQNQPRDGKNIFFVDTSGNFHLNARQACAIESAAKLNPVYKVFVMFTSEDSILNPFRTQIIDAVLSYENVLFNYVPIKEYTVDTPLEEFIKEDHLSQSKFQSSHTADVVRFLTLFKYGGIYLDLDVVVLKPLHSIPPNFVGSENEDTVGSAIISMEKDGFGHEIANACVKDLVANFDGQQRKQNSNVLLTKMLQNLCNTSKTKEMTVETCKGFRVLPSKDCYAINYIEYTKFFDEYQSKETIKKLKDSLIAHIWNKQTSQIRLSVHSSAAYIELAKENCPKVLHACRDHF
ncbi:unnamed protein product [Diamesa hyperborea]